jgi:hypothetical protein
MTLGTTPRVITNNMVTGTALSLGNATAVSTLALNATLQLQSQNNGGPTIINDLIQDGTNAAGGILVTSGLTQLTNTGNTYSGGSTVNGGTLSVSADGNLGAATGTVSIGAGTLLSTGSFTTSRTVNFTDPSLSTIDATGTNTLSLTGTVTDAGTLNKGSNSGTVQLAMAAGYSANNNVNVQGGALSIGNAGVATGPLVVPGTLNISDNARLTLGHSSVGIGTSTNGAGVMHTVNTLNLNTSGQLDLDDNALTIGSGVASSTVQQYLKNGYNGGAWNGTGGISSTWASPGTSVAHTKALGYVTQANGSTLVAATLYGDTNLKGSVGLSDYNILAFNFNKPGNWSQGDFDYDGTVGLSDYNLLAFNFNKPATAASGLAQPAAGGASPPAVTRAGPVTLTRSASASASSSVTATPAFVDPGVGNVALEADPTSGKLYVVGHDANINSYEVDSASGKLSAFASGRTAGGYNTLSNQSNAAPLPGSSRGLSEGIWTVINSENGVFMAESYPTSSAPPFDNIGPGLQELDLNSTGQSAWTAGTPVSDLSFKYGDGTSATLTPAVIDLSASGVPEPTGLGLIGLAAGGVLGRRKRRKA